jgi:hypothetical protein
MKAGTLAPLPPSRFHELLLHSGHSAFAFTPAKNRNNSVSEIVTCVGTGDGVNDGSSDFFVMCDNRTMPTRSSKEHDFTRLALRTVEQVIGEQWDGSPLPESTKNPHAVALGKLGGAKGGAARASKLTPEQRSDIAKIAASARWKKT